MYTRDCHAASVKGHEFGEFEVAAMAMVQEANGLRDQVKPEATEGFRKLLQYRPDAICYDGKTWALRLPASKQATRLDLQEFPVAATDLDAATAMLRLDYVDTWVNVMNSAAKGHATRESLEKLAAKIEEMRDEGLKWLLRANLGARLLAHAPKNREWDRLLLSDPQAWVPKLLAARIELEGEKARAAAADAAGEARPGPGKFPVTIVGDLRRPWADIRHAMEAKRLPLSAPGPRSVYTWNLPSRDGSPSVEQYLPSRRPSGTVHVLFLSWEEALLLVGNLEPGQVRELKAITSWDAFTAKSKELGHVYMSRPGSAILGKISVR